MSLQTSQETVRARAHVGNRVRRVTRALVFVVRVAPYVAGVALAAALVSLSLAGPRWLGLGFLAVSLVALVVALVVARRDTPVTDDDARELDRAADLGGALRSAFWFSEADHAATSRENQFWIAHHVHAAAERVEHINWANVFPKPRARGRLATSAALAAATIAFTLWRPSFLPGRSTATAAGADGETSAAAATIPATLMPQLVEGMRAMKSGQKLSKESLAAIGQALELARGDERLKSQLAEMFTEAGEFPDDLQLPTGFVEFDQEDYEMRGGEMLYTGQKTAAMSLEWAYKQAESRAAAEQGEQGEKEGDPAADGEGDMEAGDSASAEAGMASISPQSDPGGQNGEKPSFSSLLFGKQASGDGKSTAGSPTRSAALVAALKREVIHAQKDMAGQTGAPTGSRRTTNARPAGDNSVLAEARMTYDRARATRPPAVPEARRPLVHDFFTRPAEAPVGSKQP